jgi:ubiquinone/menaquinone biosynthesis C-methylase UbiE
VAAAGLRNVSFLNADVNNIVTDRPFDAVVGRFILMFLPDPVSVLRSVSRLVRPGGVLAFQEPSWIPLLALGDRLPLWSCVLRSHVPSRDKTPRHIRSEPLGPQLGFKSTPCQSVKIC